MFLGEGGLLLLLYMTLTDRTPKRALTLKRNNITCCCIAKQLSNVSLMNKTDSFVQDLSHWSNLISNVAVSWQCITQQYNLRVAQRTFEGSGYRGIAN